MSDDKRTIYCGNLSKKITEELLYELFLQAAPVERVKIPKDPNGYNLGYGFVTLKHEISVEYVLNLLNGIVLYKKRINIKPRNSSNSNNNNQHSIQLDSHTIDDCNKQFFNTFNNIINTKMENLLHFNDERQEQRFKEREHNFQNRNRQNSRSNHIYKHSGRFDRKYKPY